MFWLQVTLPESRTFGCMVNTKGPHGMLSWNISIQGNSVVRCVCACVLFHHYGAPKGHQNCLFHTLWVNLDTVIGNTCSTSSKSFCTLLHLNEPNMVCLHTIFKLSKHDVCVAYKLKSPVHCNRMFGWDFTFLWTWDKNKAEASLLPKCVEVTSAWEHMHFKLVSSSTCLKVSAGSLTAPSTYTTPQWFT